MFKFSAYNTALKTQAFPRPGEGPADGRARVTPHGRAARRQPPPTGWDTVQRKPPPAPYGHPHFLEPTLRAEWALCLIKQK